jgi:hemolysin activation/secretion protein
MATSPSLAQVPTFPPSSSPRDILVPPRETPQEPTLPSQPEESVEPLPPTPEPITEPSPEPPPITESEPQPGEIPDTITIGRFEFEGNTVISDEELAEATREYVGRPLTFTEVYEVRSVITQLYSDRGYFTSGAIIPPQTFEPEAEVVTIRVLEGELEKIDIRGTRHLDPDYIRSRIATRTSEPINRAQLIEALQLLQLDPLIANISAELAAGTQQGSSLLIVEVEEAKTISAGLSLNNNRSPTIGTFETRLEFTQANFTGRGDSLSIDYGNTDGSDSIDASYTYPLNPRNGTLSFSTGVAYSTVVESPFDRIDLDANSRYFQLSYRQPLWRDLSEEFALGVTASNQASEVTVFDIPVRLTEGADEDGRTSVTALRFFQDWTRQSAREVLGVRSQFTLGLGLFNATTNEDAPDSRFLSWRGQVQWVRLFAPNTFLILQGSVQLADQPLLSLEQIGTGGQDTVRGYRQNAFLTDNGAVISAEFRFPIARLPEQNGLLQLAPFFDIGAAWNSADSPLPDPDPNILASLGLGLQFQLGENLTARLDWGIPLTDVPAGDDNTLQENGVHFAVNYRFFF